MNRLHRAAAWLARPFRPRPASASGPRTAAPLWVRGLTAGGRPVVLSVALLMCAPGEYHLAETAGWDDPFTYGMPVVLSAYAGIAAAVASTRRPGDRGRWSAIVGACLALGLAMAAQVVSHLITTGHVVADQPMLIAVTSLVPPAVVGHLLHLAASPPDAHRDAQDATASTTVPSVPVSTAVDTTEPVEPPVVTLERDEQQDADGTPELPPGTQQDTQDADASPAVLSVPPIPEVVPPGVRLLPMAARPAPPTTLEPDTEQDAEDADDGPPPEPPLMTSAQVAQRYGIEMSTVRTWVAAERLTVHSKDARGRNLFHEDELPEREGVPA